MYRLAPHPLFTYALFMASAGGQTHNFMILMNNDLILAKKGILSIKGGNYGCFLSVVMEFAEFLVICQK